MEKYDLRTLPDSGAVLEHPLATEWLSGVLSDAVHTDGLEFRVDDPGHVKLRLTRIDPEDSGSMVVRVDGHFELALHTDCVRCLEALEKTMRAEIDVTYFPNDSEASPPEGLDELRYDNMELDLPALLRETLLVDLDLNPACEEEPGCDERTQALIASVSPTGWDEKPEIDPRWEALKKIQLKS